MKRFRVGMMLGLMSFATAAPSAPLLSQEQAVALSRLLESDWSALTPTMLREMWPEGNLHSQAASQACEGSVSLTRITAAARDGFTFVRVQGSGCVEHLTAVSLERRVREKRDATELGAQLRKVVMQREAQLINDKNGYTIVSWPMPGVNQTAWLSIAGHRVRFTVFRTELKR